MMKQLPKMSLQNRGIMLLICGLLLSVTTYAQLPTATQVAANMRVGINVGNTLEAIGGETAWGNPVITQTYINAVKAAGFNTVRLPISWDTHANQSTGVIDAAWMARVKQVVDYCINQNLYVIINIHWDNGWLENNVTAAAQSAVNAKQRNYWTQIANYFKTYDQRVIFAGANEPAVSDATGMSVLLSYHQTFINAVRATGGNNSSRTLIIQGPATDIEQTNLLMNTMPTDQIANRLMVEVHYYSPYQFCLMSEDASWGNMFYYWGNGYHSSIDPSRNATWGEESDLNNYFSMMQTKFVSKGIPVIIGEFGAYKRTGIQDQALHNASIEYFNKYVVQSARSHGMIPYYWDIGGLIDRNSGAIKDQSLLNAIMQGAGSSPSCTPTTITPYAQINGGSWSQTANASLSVGGSVKFGPQPASGGSWSWSGPNSFSATTREITVSNIQTNQAGNYVATYTNASGCQSNQTFAVSVTGATNTLTVSTASVSLGAGSSSQSITVNSNVSWAITDNQTWITTSATSGSNNGSFTINASANTATSSRTGTVTITGGNISRTITVTQSGASCTPTAITAYAQINGGSWSQSANASLTAGGTVKFGPQPTSGGTWTWSGPNAFNSTSREITISNIQTSQAGNYVATFTNSSGCQSTQTFVVTVTGGSSAIVVRARGAVGGEKIELRANGSTIATWILTTTYTSYTASGSGSVAVYFTNDSGNLDAQIDYITIGGTTYQSENQATNTGVWTGTCGGSYSEWLHCNGYISYTTAGGRAAQTESVVNDTNILMYPNPTTTGKFTIELPTDVTNASVKIIDIEGRLVHTQTATGRMIEIATDLKGGIYFVHFYSESYEAMKKIVVKH
jgi:aryl-phospho-beta-D-glucosidase BglC (GH1 family)